MGELDSRIFAPTLSVARKLRFACVASAIVFAAHTAMPPPIAAANYSNCAEGTIVNRHQGHALQTATQKHGISAVLENDYLNQCTPFPGSVEYSGNFMFVNIVPSTEGYNNIIQIGVGNCRGFGSSCATGMQYYYAWGRDDAAPGCAGWSDHEPYLYRYDGWSSGSKTLSLQHRNNYWQYEISGTTRLSIPESWICWTPRKAIWFGESWDKADAIGGTSADPFSFTQTQYRNTEGGPLYATSFSASATCNWRDGPWPYDCGVAGSQTINVWTYNR